VTSSGLFGMTSSINFLPGNALPIIKVTATRTELCYTFEVVTPQVNKISRFPSNAIYFLGAHHTETLEYFEFQEWKIPKEFSGEFSGKFL
jgi:hypothetical protein